MKGVLPSLVRWARRDGTRYFVPPWLPSVKYFFFLAVHHFKLSPSKLEGSRAGSPISQCVSLVVNSTFEKKLNDSCLCDVQNESFYLDHKEV
jgi:hypothetical protein